MTDATADKAENAARPSKLPFIIGVALALAGGGGGFYAVSSGLIGGRGAPEEATAGEAETGSIDAIGDRTPLGDIAFVEIPPVAVPLGPASEGRFLRFRISLEVPRVHADAVTGLTPRVQDVLNSYLRALDPEEFDAPGSIVRLRTQLLRRIKLVAGEAMVRDVLILEFIVN